MKASQQKKPLDKASAAKFIVCSLLGVFLFFIQIPVNGVKTLPIDMVTSLFTNALSTHYTEVLLVCTALYVVNLVHNWNKKKMSAADIVIMVLSILGGIMIVMMEFKIGPAFLFESDIIPAAVSNMGKAFVMVYIVTFFLPFLLNYGLVDFFGVIFRPVMRLIFKLPGRTAVVAIGAFLGNFTVGHIQANELYVSGKITTREANIIDTCFCTTSIALLLLFANSTGQISNWNKVFFVTLVTVYVVSAIVVHLPPLSRISDNYYEGTTPNPEVLVRNNILSEAFQTGVDAATKSPNPLKAVWLSGKNSLMMVAAIHVSSVATWVLPALVNKYTPIFKWLGNIFLPILNIIGMPNAAELSQAIGLSFVNPISATVGLGAMKLEPAAMFFAACFAAPIVIFFGAFLSSMYSTKVPVKFSHVILVWFERAILVVVILGLVCKIMF